MIIRYVSMNVVGHTLFIDLRDEQTRKLVDDLNEDTCHGPLTFHRRFIFSLFPQTSVFRFLLLLLTLLDG